MVATVTLTTIAAHCWTCDSGPHAQTDHDYRTEVEAPAWYAQRPDSTVTPMSDGAVYTYATIGA